jgi:alpha-tubulin suppressor-like RCC1 family protein
VGNASKSVRRLLKMGLIDKKVANSAKVLYNSNMLIINRHGIMKILRARPLTTLLSATGLVASLVVALVFYVANTTATSGQAGAQVSIRADQFAGSGVIDFDATDVAQVFSGGATTYALLENGTMLSWGRGDYGQRGDNTTAPAAKWYPGRILNQTGTDLLSGVEQFSAGDSAGYALLTDGTALAWGYNSFGQLGIPTATTYRSLPTPITSDGVSPLTGVAGLYGGNNVAYAVMDDSTVLSFGTNAFGQLGNNNSGLTSNSIPSPVYSSSTNTILSGVKSIAASGRTAYALMDDGRVMAWGAGDQGQMGSGGSNVTRNYYARYVKTNSAGTTDLTNVVAIAAGDYNGYAILSNGTVMAWGSGANGALGDGTTTTKNYAVPVSGLSNITEIVAGSWAAWALDGNGQVWSWGQNTSGQLGNNNSTASNIPNKVVGLGGIGLLDNARTISGNAMSATAVLDDDTMVAWGSDSYYQTGNYAIVTTYTNRPIIVNQRPFQTKSGTQNVIVSATDDFDTWKTFSIANTIGRHTFDAGTLIYSLLESDCTTPIPGISNPVFTVDSKWVGTDSIDVSDLPPTTKSWCVSINYNGVGDVNTIISFTYGDTPAETAPDIPSVPNTGGACLADQIK